MSNVNVKCQLCDDTGLVLYHPSGVPFSQSLADLEDCPNGCLVSLFAHMEPTECVPERTIESSEQT